MSAKLKAPKKVRIGAHWYSIEFGCWDEDWIGETSNQHLYIRIQEHLQESMKKETLLHEILHALWYCSSVRLNAAIEASAFGRTIEFDAEEHVIDALDGPLLAAMLDNPKVFAWIVS